MYINPKTLSNQSTPAPGLLLLTAEQEAVYIQYNGFIHITSIDPVTIEPDTAAYEAWKAAKAKKLTAVTQPTIEERITALELAQLYQIGVTPNV